MRTQIKKTITKIFIGFIAILLLLFVARNPIARFIFHKVATQTDNRYGIAVSTNTLRVRGISTIELEGFLVKSSDTLIHSDYIQMRLNPFYLLALKINPQYIAVSNANVRVDIILKNKNAYQNNSTAKTIDLVKSSNKRLYYAIKSFFGLSTSKFQIDNLVLFYSDSTYKGMVKLDDWHYGNGRFSSKAILIDGSDTSLVNITGKTSKANNSVYAEIVSTSDEAKVPFFQPILGISLSLKKSKISIAANKLSSNEIDLALGSRFEGMTLKGKRISEVPVRIKNSVFSLNLTIEPYRWVIDSTSWVSVNDFKANIWVEYLIRPDDRLSFMVQTPFNTWQNLIDALPEGLFTNLTGCRVRGTFNYSLRVDIPLNQPDSLTIQPKLSSSGFSMASFGKTNIFAITDTFTHKAYNNFGFIRNIHVGPSNKRFTPLNQISPYLQWAVITSEDGGFYHHRGFSLEGITYAMACNIREKRFARGGSTISQQLVKNLYLTQSKNIGRKAEEILITWIIENSQVVSKERLLEIYLNIIEWGPNIYGINEASDYYFNKHPRELNLSESLFLAYIIPRPTKFRYLFDSDGNLKQFVIDNSRFVAKKMLGRGNITQEEFDKFKGSPNVRLTGKAKELLKTSAFVEEVADDELFTDSEE